MAGKSVPNIVVLEQGSTYLIIYALNLKKANVSSFIFQFAKVTRNPDVIRSLPHVNVYCPYLGHGIRIFYDDNFEFTAFAF